MVNNVVSLLWQLNPNPLTTTQYCEDSATQSLGPLKRSWKVPVCTCARLCDTQRAAFASSSPQNLTALDSTPPAKGLTISLRTRLYAKEPQPIECN